MKHAHSSHAMSSSAQVRKRKAHRIKQKLRKDAHAVLSVLVAVVMVFSLSPLYAIADSSQPQSLPEVSDVPAPDGAEGDANTSEGGKTTNLDETLGGSLLAAPPGQPAAEGQGEGVVPAQDDKGMPAVGGAPAPSGDSGIQGQLAEGQSNPSNNEKAGKGSSEADKPNQDSGAKDKEENAEDKDKDAEVPDSAEGASVHEEQDLYQVGLFGPASSNPDAAADAIADASIEDPSVDPIALPEAKFMARTMFAALGASGASNYPYPRRADGSDVEAISIRWISKDTEENGDDSLLYLVPDGDAAFSVRFQVDYALSGEHNYQPGDIQIRIPAQVFHKRDSNTTSANSRHTGNMLIPLAQSPSTNTDFNWALIDGEYVLTNTKSIVAATKGFVQFEIKDLVPHEIVDMSITDGLQATIEVTTHMGNIIGLQSGIIKAQVNTTQEVVRANKDVSSTSIVGASEVGAIPAEIKRKYPNDTSFLLVTWYAYPYHTGNQPYTLTGYDTRTDVATGATSATKHDGWVIEGDTTTTKDLGTIQEGWYTPGRSTTSNIKVAYPMSQFAKDTVYTFTNHVDYDLYPIDGVDAPTRVGADAKTTWSYRDPKWVDPPGHFNVFKWGNDNDYGMRSDGELTTHYKTWERDDIPTTDGTNTAPQHLQGWYGLYKKALNEMRDGEDYEIAYTIKTDGYVLPWTYEGDTRLEESYGKRPVTMVTEDTGLWVGSQTSRVFDLVPGDNMDFTSISFVKPIIGKIKAINVNPDGSFATKYVTTSNGVASDGTFDYEADTDDSHIPPIILEVQRKGKWEQYASADWSSGSCVITLANGTVVNGEKIDFPAGTQNFRTKVTSKKENASIVYCVRPSVMLHNTKQWRDLIEQLFETYSAPSEDVWNSVRLDAYAHGGNKLVEIRKNGYDRLMGYRTDLAVIPHKSGEVNETLDYENKLVELTYSARIEERSVIADLELYKDALETGIIAAETHGVWYDLLPLGVNPKMDTIKLRKGDTIKDAYTIPDYHGSGRTMLVVEADLTPAPQSYVENDIEFYEDVPSITFDAVCDINYIIDYGQITEPDDLFSADLHNVIAFESSNDALGDVEGYRAEKNDPNGTNNVRTPESWSPVEKDAAIEKEAMTGLDGGRDTQSFLYAGVNNHVEILNAASTSLLKEVSVNNDGRWSHGTYYGNREANARDVYEGGMYSYRIFAMSNANTQTKDMILFDSLENYVAIKGNDQEDVDALAAGKRWRGVLRSVDVSPLRAEGIDAVVYYSTVPELQMQEVDDPLGGHIHAENTDLSNSSIWTKASDYTGDLADVHAIAIDCRKGLNGKDFILQPEHTVAAYINMWAPQGEEASHYITNDHHAYNNIFLDCVSIDARTGGAGEKLFVRQDYVKVGLVEHSVTVNKDWDDNDDRDGIRPDEVTFVLMCDNKVFDPADTGNPLAEPIQNPVTVKADSEGKISYTFKHLPYCDDEGRVHSYAVLEQVPDGYTPHITRSEDGREITITNTHQPETTSVSGTKTWVGDTDEVRPTMIQVELYADGELTSRQNVVPDADGRWSYSFDNLLKYRDHGVEIVYTVQERRVFGGSLEPYITELNGFDIVNTYHPFGDVELTKSVEGATSATSDDTFPFEFTIANAEGAPIFDEFSYEVLDANDAVVREGTVTTGSTVELSDTETIRIKELPQQATVTAVEVVPAGYVVRGGETHELVVKANQTVSAEVVNTYKTQGYVNLRATKTLENREMKNYQFRFNLTTDVAGKNVIDAASSRIDGTVTFGALEYTNADAGKTYTYYIHELDFGRPGYTYDSSVYRVRVRVVDNGDGTMTATPTYYQKNAEGTWESLGRGTVPAFVNEYHAKGDLEVKAWKALQKRDLKANEFTFELVDSQGTVVATAKNGANGVVTFSKIHFDEKAIGKSFDYTIREKAGKDNTVIYSTETYSVHVDVSDNGDGTLSFEQTVTNAAGADATPVFTNDLKDGKLAVEKHVADGTAGEFKFKVKLTGPDVPADGTYEFTKEQITGGAGIGIGGGLEAGFMALVNEVAKVFAPEPAYAAEAWTNHTANGSSIKWKIEGNTLYVEPISGEVGVLNYPFPTTSGHSAYYEKGPWFKDSNKETVTKIVSTGTIKLQEAAGLGLFYNFKALTDISALSSWDVSGLTHMGWEGNRAAGMFKSCSSLKDFSAIQNWNVSKVVNMSSTFGDCTSVESLDLSKWNVSKLEYLYATFDGCSSLASLNVSTWQTPALVSMGSAFGCAILPSLDISNFDTSKVERMSSAFGACKNLKEVKLGKNWTVWQNAQLPKPKGLEYSGRWVRVPANGIPSKTPAELQDEYPAAASTWAGTWVWEEQSHPVKFFKDGSKTAEPLMDDDSVAFSEVLTWQLPEYTGENADLFEGWGVSFYMPSMGGLYAARTYNTDGYTLKATTNLLAPGSTLVDAYVASAPSDATPERTAKALFGQFITYSEGSAYAFYPSFAPTYTIKYTSDEAGTSVYNTVDKIKGSDLANYALAEYTYSDQPIAGWKVVSPKYLAGDAMPAGTKLGDVVSESTTLAARIIDNAETEVILAPVYLTSYQVDFLPGEGATGSMASLTDQPMNQDVTIPEPTFYYFNHHVVGWVDENGNKFAADKIPANTVTKAKITLTAEWEPDDNSVQMKGGEFEFTLKSNERAIFDKIPAGTAYQVWEETPAGWVLVQSVNTAGKIEPLETATASFTNEYNPNAASIQLQASKTLDGKPANEGVFEFTLSKDGSAIQTITNASGGGVVFDPIKYTRSDIGTHTYTIEEVPGNSAAITYDTHTETVTVTVSDDGKGNLVATAAYDSDGAVFANKTNVGKISLEKLVTGSGAPNDAEFTFVVTLSAPGEFAYSGSHKGTIRSGGTITLKAGEKVTISGLPVGTTYNISETNIPSEFELAGATGDQGAVSSKTAKAVFTNAYNTDLAAASINLQVRKVFEGGTLEAGQFSFQLLDAGNNVIEVASNDASGKVGFGLIEFDAPGTYTFTVHEIAGDDEAVVYDTEDKTITVTVAPDPTDATKLVATTDYDPEDASTIPTFVNSAKTGELAILKASDEVTEASTAKTFPFIVTFEDAQGNPLAGSFNWTAFNLRGDEVQQVGKGTISSGGQVSIGSREYVRIIGIPLGTVYRVEEAAVPGFTLDQIRGDEGVIGENATSLSICAALNTYSSSGEVELHARKTLEGRPLTDGQFTFELRDANDQVLAYATNDAEGNINFPAIPYTEEDDGKTFTYTIAEVKADDPGYTYDDTVLTVTVAVADRGDGTMKATATYEGDSTTLRNVYDAQGEAVLQATKSLTGRALDKDKFTFEVVDSQGTVLRTATNAADGTVTFAPIVYVLADAGKTFDYIIREVVPEGATDNGDGTYTKDGYTYDTHAEAVTVTVTDSGYGYLNAELVYDEDGASFANDYKAAGQVSLEATKALSGRALAAEQFTFELIDAEGEVLATAANDADGKVAFAPIAYTQADAGKEFAYTIREVAPVPTPAGYTYDTHAEAVSVKVADNGDGTLSCTPTYDRDGAKFTNKYRARGSVVLRASKALAGRALEAGQFSFELLDAEGAVVSTATNAADGRIAFPRISYTQADAGKTFAYTIREVVPVPTPAGYTYDAHAEAVSVKVADNGDGTLACTTSYDADGAKFTNEYTATGEVVLEAAKTLSGRALRAEQFSFELRDADGVVLATASNSKAGKVVFPAISYTQADAGKEFAYTIHEIVPVPTPSGYTYDSHVEAVTVAVVDNGDGTLTATATYDADGAAFANSYEASGSATLRAEKILEGRALVKGQFTFELLDAEGKVLATATNAADGRVAFPRISYTQADAGKTFAYTIREVAPVPTPPGYTYDETVLKATVTVADRGNGTLKCTVAYEGESNTLRNVYEAAGEATFEASKTLSGRALEVGQFSFHLCNEAGEVLLTATNDAEGKVAFGALAYTQADAGKTFTYTIREAVSVPMPAGYTYDTHEETVSVKVVDKGDGTLSCTTTYDKDGATFANDYQAAGQVSLEATKVLSGRALAAEQFSFELLDAEGELLATVANDADGKVAFAPIAYTQADAGKTFAYTIREVVPADEDKAPGYTYDTHAEAVSVKVADKGDGTLSCTPTYGETGGVFTNVYTAKDQVAFVATKTLEGSTLVAGEFSFQLCNEEGEVLQTVTNDADGKIEFEPVSITQDDAGKTRVFTITEVNAGAKGYTYDTHVEKVEVAVVDNGDGTLTCTTSYDEDGAAFVNSYKEVPDEKESSTKGGASGSGSRSNDESSNNTRISGGSGGSSTTRTLVGTTKSPTTPKSTSSTAKTSDTAPLTSLILLAMASLGAAVYALGAQRRRKEERSF